VNTSREEILRRIRSALGDVPASEQPDDVAVVRSYRIADPALSAAWIDLFVERAREYGAIVRRVTAADLPQAITLVCAARGVKRLVVPADLPADWAPTGVELLREPGLSLLDLERSDGVLTACTLAIAQTGTIALDGGPIQGRRVITLLPDFHLCVIREDQVVSLVPEAVSILSAAAADPRRPITLVSGPSATSDIELSRVEGVHGPRSLEVFLVAS
jgi:L-lactate dehydrogenase complex protein LldG